jgi:hypothetical protein
VSAPSKKIWQLITPEAWCKRDLVRYYTKRPAAYCAFGWLKKIYGPDFYPQVVKLEGVIQAMTVSWNDDPKRTFKQVKAAFRRANL